MSMLGKPLLQAAPMSVLERVRTPHRAYGLNRCGRGRRSSRKRGSSWSKSTPNSSARSTAAGTVGAHAPSPTTSTRESSQTRAPATTKVPRTSLGRARTSLSWQLCLKSSPRQRLIRFVMLMTSSARCLIVRLYSKWRACYVVIEGLRPASIRL